MVGEDFKARGFRAVRSADGELIKLQFVDAADAQCNVVMPIAWLPSILQELHGKIGSNSIVPIDRGSMQTAQSFALQGFRIEPHTEGAILLTLIVDLLDQQRVVTVPLVLSRKECSEIIGDLSKALA